MASNKKNKSMGFKSSGNNNKFGFKTVPNDSVQWRLQTADGKYFGDVSYDAYKAVEGGTLDSYKAKNDAEKDAISKFRSHRGFTLKGNDGTEFGNVSYDAYNAVQTFKLDSYLSKATEDEKKVLENFKKNNKVDFIGSDGKSLGKISYEGYTHIANKGFDGYTAKNNEESNTIAAIKKQRSIPLVIEVDGKKKDFGKINYYELKYINGDVGYTSLNDNEKSQALKDFEKYVAEQAKKEREPENWWKGILHGLGYTAEKIGAGAVGGIEDAGNFLGAVGAKALAALAPEGQAKDDLNKFAKGRFEYKTIGDMWDESAESRYRVPDWYRDNFGVAASNLGNMIPAMAAEIYTGGVAPTMDTLLAKSLYSSATKAGVSSVAKSLSSKLITPKASDVMFGLSAAGSSAKVGYAQTGNLGQALSYGALNGLGEVATEKLFGGYGGTGIGADELFDLSKIKGVSKLASNKYGKKVLDIALEGVEEVVMADLEPWFRKATIDPNAKISNFTELQFWKDRGEAFKSGVLLSVLSNAATYTGGKAIGTISNAKQRIQAVNTLNKSAENLNGLLPSESQFEPLKYTASVEQIEKRNSEINRVKKIGVVNTASDSINAILKNDGDKLVPLKYDSTEAEIQQRQKEIDVFSRAYADLMVDELTKNNPEIFAGVEKTSVGDQFIDTKTGYAVTVVDRDAKNTTVEINTGKATATKVFSNNQADNFATNGQLVEVDNTATPESAESTNPTPIAEDVTAKKNIILKRVGDNYEVYGDEAVALANNLGVETERAVVNGTETDILRVPADLMVEASKTMEDDFNFVFSDKSISENSPVTNETVSMDETTPVAEENATDAKIAVVVDAINDTLLPEAKEGILVGMNNKGVDGGFVEFAEALTRMYEKSGSLGPMAKYFSDNGARVISAMEGKTEAVRTAVSEETSVVSETSPTETPTVSEMSPVESTNKNKELNSLYEQRDELNSLVEEMKNQGVEQSEIDKTKELVDEIETEIARLEQEDLKSEALTNQSESATMKEKAKPNTESKTVEREDGNNERRRESVLPENGRRRNDGGARKQISRLSSFERRNQGKNEAERKSFTRGLVDGGQVENINDGKCEYTLVKPEAYNDDMSSMVKDAKSKGVELGFMVGNAKVLQIEGEGFYVDGIKFNSSKVIVRYDGGRPPQKIAKHEMVHAKWNTAEVQKAKNTILDSLTEEKKQEILSQERYARYKSEAYNGSEEIALEEFVCDVMAGMNKYTIDHIDTVDDYWNENEVADGYNPADYAISTDAGGEERYSLFPGGVFPPYNKSHSDANERATRWAHNEDIETGAQRIFFYKGSPYLVEKFDSMDLGYLVVEKISKKSLSRYERNMIEYEERDKDGGNNGPQPGRKASVSDNERNQGFRESGRRGSDDNNSSDKHNGETAEVQGMDREQDKERGSRNNRSRDNKHSVEDREEVSHSLKDSTGRKLSKGQIDYFKDSKERDKNGNLKVMYRGDKENFTVFDKKKTRHSNLYGRGFYFTDSKSHAEQYGDAKEYYLNITNPLSPKQNAITKEQMLDFLEAIENNGEDYDLYNYGQDATAESVLNSVWGKGDFEMLQDINAGAIGDLVAAVELFNEVNGTNYDGIVLPTETVTFNSEQAKLTSNLNPTKDKDVRFSFAEPVEETKNLVAVHNLSPEKLLKTLKLGGLPMPSIAITRAREGYNNFGAISLVFGKETIDPKFFRSNKVYSGDAWTPTYPQVAYKLNTKAQEQIKKKIDALVPSKVRDDLGGLHLDSTNMEYELNRSGDMVQSYRYNYAMKYAFLKDKGTDIELPTKDEPLYRYGEVSNDAVISFAHKMVDGLKTVNSLLEQHSSKLMADTDLINGIATVLNEEVLSSVEENSERYKMLAENPLFKAEDIDLSTVLGMLEAARKYFHTNGKIDSKVDYKEARTIIDEKVDMAEYESWLKELFADVVAKEGIRNNKDLFTPSGNRRSFEALHYEHNLENVIKAMKEEGTKGIGGFGGGNIFGASTNEYNSIEDIKSDAENRMQQLPESKYDEIKKGFRDRFLELASSLPIHKDSFSAIDDAANMLVEAVSKFKTKSGMANYLRTESKGWANYSDYIVDGLIELVNDIRNMPVAYFEAKPQRAVGYDEIRAVIMPTQESYEDDLSEIKNELEKIGIPILEYEYGDNNDRIKALNSVEDARFSFAEKDTEYLELAKDPVKNEAKLMEMVDAKAVESGVDTDSNGKPIALYHGTSDFGFTTVDTEYSDDKLTFWATSELAVAKSYHGHGFGFKPHEGVRQIGNPTEIVKKPKLDAQKDSATKIVETAAEVFPEYKDATVLTDKQKLKEAKKDIASAYKTAKKLMKSKELTEADAEIVRSFIDAVNEGTCEALTEACVAYEKVDAQRADSWFDDDVSRYEERFQTLTEKMEEIHEVVRPDYVLFDGDVLYTSYIAARYNAETGNNGVYKFYYKSEKPYVIDCKGENWNRIEPPAEISPTGERMNTRQIARWAFENGYDSVKYVNAIDMGSKKVDSVSATVWAFMNPKEQLKSADPVTYDDDGNVIPLSERFNKKNDDIRYSISKQNNLETQKKIEGIAEDIGSHDELIEYAKKNTKEFVAKIKENESLQKRLDNAKRQTSLSPTPVVNTTKAGNITKEILNEMESTLKATDLRDEVMSIYNEYFDAMKKAKNVKSKVQEANNNMLERFGRLAVDIVDSSVAYTESEEHELLKSYVKNTRINIPEDAKGEAHYAEFRKSHMGTFNLTNDGLPIDRAYQELCELFPGLFSEEVTAPADQLNAIAEALETTKPYAYNPHKSYMADAVEHVVYRFASEVDGLAVMPKTKAQKIAEKGAYDKNMALDKERTEFARKLDKHKAQSENTIRKLQKKIDDAGYVRYWEKRLSKEEKADAIKKVRDNRDVAILKSKIRNIVSDMKKKLDKTEKAGGYPKELVKVAAEICSVLDFHTDRTGKNGTPTKASLKLDALKMQYDALKSNPNYDFASEYSEELSDKILKLNEAISGKRVVDLSKSELTNLKDILSEISTRLSEASKQIGQANAKANAEIATEIINSLKLGNKAISEVRNQLLKEMKLAKESGKAFVVNPHRIFEMIANYDRDSAWWQLYDQILRGSRNSAKFTMDATMPFDELTDGSGNEIAFYDFRTKMHKTGIKYQDGNEVELPKSIICELVMLWDRKQGRNHLEMGGVKIPDLKLFNKGKTADALASGKMTNAITQADITRLKGMLDSYDKAWIEKSRHLFNKVAKDAINEISMQLVGREVAKADNYIRIYVDSDFIREDIGKNESDITIEGHGSLKETTPDAKNPLVVRGLHENVFDHIDFASKYYGLAIPIRNFNKVYKISINDKGNFDSVKNALGSVYGPKIRDGVVVQVIKDLQSPRHRELSLFNKVKGGWLNATFFANIRSTLKQTTSYWTSSSILGEDSLVKGLASYIAHRKQTKAEINKYSGTLYKRSQGLSTTELGDRANRKRLAGLSSKTTKFINNKLPVLRKIPEWIRPGNWLQSMDCAVSSALWEACKHQVSKTMKATDDGYMEAVRDLYERVIEETQSNYDMLHRPEILKSTNMTWQTVGMFQNDNLQQTGIMYSALGDLRAKKKAYEADKSSANEQKLKDAKKRMGKAVRSRVYSSVWLVAVSMLGDAILRKFKPYIDDEEKEITAGSVLEQMMLNMSEDTLSVLFPVVGQLATKAMDTFGEGYDFLNDPAFDVLEDFIKATSKIYKAYDEDGDVLKAWTDAIPAISNMTGVPAKNISDLYNGIKGYVGDIKAGEFAHDLTDYSGGKSFYNYGDLASYIVSGDKEKEKKLLDYYSENGKEIAKGSLTQEIKPAYVQMYIDSPKEAYNLKRKLILEYDYSEETIGNWTIAEYFKHAIPGKKYDDDVVSNPEYASEIASAVQGEKNWKDSYYSTIRSQYKDVYEDGEKGEIESLKKALINDFNISSSDIGMWETEADEKIKKREEAKEAEKKKYR